MRIRQLLAVLFIAVAPVLALAQICDDDSDNGCLVTVPEPATLALLGAGVAALIVGRRNKRK